TGRPHCVEITLGPLDATNAGALLDALLGRRPGLESLKTMLVERTGGNPFFLEESVRSLADVGVLAGEAGDYRLARALPEMPVAPTVQAVIAARIDRLDPEDKRILQCAAVVGTIVTQAILEAIVQLPETELRQRLWRLEHAGFLHEMGLFPEPEWTFRHGL